MAMYVSGRKGKPQEDCCDHCRMTGQSVTAACYCPTCDEFLCPPCSIIHAGANLTKGHVMQDLDKSATCAQSDVTVPKWQECPEHAGEAIRLFCKSHDALCCLICLRKYHKSCLNTALISDLAKRFNESDEFRSFKTDLINAESDKSTQRKIHKASEKKIETEYIKALTDIDTIAEKAHSRIDELKENTVKIAEKTMGENKFKLKQIDESLCQLESDIQSLIADIEREEITQQPERLFIAWKNSQSRMEKAKCKMSQLKEENSIKSLRLEPTEDIETRLNAKSVLGTFSEAHLRLKYVGEINAKSPSEKENCTISGIVQASPRQMIITDSENENIKVIDIRDNSIVQTRKCSGKAYDLTLLNNSKIVVPLYNEKTIQLLSADDKLAVDLDIKVNGECLSVVQEHQHGHWIVSYYERVQVLDVSGTVVREFTSDTSGNPLFKCARYLALSPYNNMLYVSDWQNNTVTCLTLDGDVKGVYRDAELRDPKGIVVDDDGRVLVCSEYTHSIHVLSPDCLKLKIIPLDQHRLQFPRAVALSPTKDRLYISSSCVTPSHCNFIKVFELH